jgi:hypothetical protein
VINWKPETQNSKSTCIFATMSTVKFTARMQRYGKNGEKSAWTYIVVTKAQANKLKPDTKKSFRVKGSFDDYKFEKVALLPAGDGDFIIPIKTPIRKMLGKEEGSTIKVVLQLDDRQPTMSADLMRSLKDEPAALAQFKSIPKSHQNYFSNWVESAKTIETKTRRIVMTIEALARKYDFGRMIRESQGKNY